MAGSNTSTTTYALQKSLRGNLRFLSMFAHLAGRDLSPSISLLLKFVNPDSPCEVLTSWSFLSIAVFWLWMLASRLGMLAVILLVASAPWWLALLPEDTPTLLATAYKTTTRLLVGEMEALFVQQATEINGLIVSLQASQAENEALTVRLREAEQRMDEGAFNSCESEFVGKLQDAQIEMMSMALTLTEKTEELATKESELEETKAELEESKLLAQDAKRIPALVNMIEDLQGELETAKELLVEKERSLQDEREQVCEKEQELGELVDELEALRDAEYRARTGAAGTAVSSLSFVPPSHSHV
ncbi:hypothetical protein L226DRAFT_118721 [Lentinus tigrinus ALCF2SS1-7]|uniref:uncharacterized protein n=1 Tax=Lentinus tigrinus ALCF2SS1-7 TaxID=1328758 RepID=UPI001165D285|nr:hypothetical protein L226DRAFT_118721 [Lentinus tigrinus ALCF2SS1-7]